MTITRSFSRKVNLGNYETVDFYSSYSQELDTEDIGEAAEYSASLQRQAIQDVETQAQEYQGQNKLDLPMLTKMVDAVCVKEGFSIESWDQLSPEQSKFIQSVKRLVERVNRQTNKTNQSTEITYE